MWVHVGIKWKLKDELSQRSARLRHESVVQTFLLLPQKGCVACSLCGNMQLLRLRLRLLTDRHKWWWACQFSTAGISVRFALLCFSCNTSVISQYCIAQVHFWHFNICWLIERLLTVDRLFVARVWVLRIWLMHTIFSNLLDVEGDCALCYALAIH